MTDSIDSTDSIDTSVNDRRILDNHISLLSVHNPEFQNFQYMSLHEVFIKLKDKYLLKNCQPLNKEDCEAINFILNQLNKHIIHYNPDLVFIFQIGSTRKRRLSSKRLTRVSKSKPKSKTRRNTRYQE